MRKFSEQVATTPKAREPFCVRVSGNVGQEIIGPDGLVYAWTTDPVRAAHICKLLTAFKNVQDKKASGS